MSSRSIDDRWFVVDKETTERRKTARYGQGLRYRARYRDAAGRMWSKSFADKKKRDAQLWLDAQTASLMAGTHVDPRSARTTVADWCDQWIAGYGTNRASTVRQARVHIKLIKAQFGARALGDVKPSDVKRWTAKMKADGKADSTVYATYRRLAQIMGDAAHDGLIPRSPCSRKTSPGAAAQRPYVATTEQVWALHDAMPDHLRPAILLGAFAGLRVSEAVALRVGDVDFMRGVVSPAIQYPAEPLKSETSKTPVPIPAELALGLAAYVKAYGGSTLVTDDIGRSSSPWAIERAVRKARSAHADPLPAGHAKDCHGCLVPDLPMGFRFHDLRHYLASLLIAKGCDVKVVQKRLRHASATTTLNTYGHMWPEQRRDHT